MIDIDNQTDLKIPTSDIEKIAKSLSSKDIDLLIVDNAQMQNINLEHRNIDAPTDVLSFPFEDMDMAPLGALVISSQYVKALSHELGHSENDEFCLLFIHGVLHLLGFDHEVDEGEMRKKEEEVIKAFNLPESLIIRTLK
ncbi:MAG TPA: rRNA maturation RNase YbeY [Sulfurimonas sp.]|nr:rRNA maturation RNase YbeY [Sulfurimonas sp.]